jgi:hypothetical protein
MMKKQQQVVSGNRWRGGDMERLIVAGSDVELRGVAEKATDMKP